MIRKATVKRVRFQEAGNPFAIVETTDAEVATWKGALGENIISGTYLEAEGNMTRDPRFGMQFQVLRVLVINRPKDDVGASWLQFRLPEIGEVRAKALSEQFGPNLANAFRSGDAERMIRSFRGLTPARLSNILRAYADHGRELPVALHLSAPRPGVPAPKKELGMAWLPIRTLIEHYEEYRGGIEALQDDSKKDAWELMAVDGITFATVNDYWQGAGLDLRDPRRMRGLLWAKLDEIAKKSGDCAMLTADVLQRMAEREYSPQQSYEILNKSTHFEFNALGAQLRTIARDEATIARSIQARESVQTSLEIEDTSGLPKWLDDSQRAAVLQLQTAGMAVLTGGPGTGKTTVLKTALSLTERAGMRVSLASPTGKAAKRMTETTGKPASTVHKLLEWTPEGFRRNATNPVEADVVVVDEASMLDTWLAANLFEALGEARLILVGDVNQLPPVGAGQPLLDIMRSGVIPVFQLTKTHRQKADSWVIDNAPLILRGAAPSLKDQSDFRFVEVQETSNIVREAINLYIEARQQGPDAEKQLQVLTPQHDAGAGVKALNTEIQRALNPKARDSRFADDAVQGQSGVLIFEKDKVMYTKNNSDIGLVNGSMGVVLETSVSGKEQSAIVRFEGDVNPETGDDVFELKDADLQPLALAYAMTVHKAQGSEWSNVVVIADKAHYSLRRKLLYTAVTRTNNFLTIIGSREAVARGARNNPDENRVTLLQQRIRGEL